MRQTLLAAWQGDRSRRWLVRLLWPLSLLYGAAFVLRRALYRAGVLPSQRLPVPVIVVGNVVAGGAGKTPVVLAVAQHLRQRGYRPGIISRGYGRRSHGVLHVGPDTAPQDCGDEPALLFRRTGLPVVVANQRLDAARALLAAHPATDILVSDDGLQHLALQRDVEICVFDAGGVGNGHLLPAGPLREPWPRAVDLIVRPPQCAVQQGYPMQRQLADWGHDANGQRTALAQLRGQALHALAGIAHPEDFFHALQAQGLTLAHTSALADHHDFVRQPIAQAPGTTTLLCTEKDAVKLWATHPQAIAVPLLVELSATFWQALDRAVGQSTASDPHQRPSS